MCENLSDFKIQNVVCCKAIVDEIDEDLDSRFDFTQMRAPPLKPISYA